MSTQALATVLTELVDGVARITINRPERHNAMDDPTSEAFGEAVTWATGSADVRAIVIGGAGRSFSSGRDTAHLGQRPGGESDYEFVLRSQRSRVALMESTKPVIAALKGAVLGGALELALSADFRIASTDARMGFPEVGFGIMTDTGGAPLTTMLAGPSRAKYLLMTAERIDAQRALEWGLVDQVVEPAELDDAVNAFATRLAAGPPLALAMIKQVVDGMWSGAVRRSLGEELLAQSALFRSGDHAEAKLARREGRPPAYRGT